MPRGAAIAGRPTLALLRRRRAAARDSWTDRRWPGPASPGLRGGGGRGRRRPARLAWPRPSSSAAAFLLLARRCRRRQFRIDRIGLQPGRRRRFGIARRRRRFGAHVDGLRLVALQRERDRDFAADGTVSSQGVRQDWPSAVRASAPGGSDSIRSTSVGRSRPEEIQARHRHRARGEGEATCHNGNNSAHGRTHH